MSSQIDRGTIVLALRGREEKALRLRGSGKGRWNPYPLGRHVEGEREDREGEDMLVSVGGNVTPDNH